MAYNDLKTGDTEPYLGKKIKTIIYSSESCIIYIDTEESIQWAGEFDEITSSMFGEVINKMSYWESICNKVFKDGAGYENKCLLAEGIARVLANSSASKYTEANSILDMTIAKIKVEAENILRNAYVVSSLASFIAIVVFIGLEEITKKIIITNLGYDWHSMCQTALVGGVGAFVSAITRAKDFKPEIIVDERIHRLDGVLRVVLGILSAIFIWLGIKSNLIFSFLNNTNKSHYIILFMGMLSGISERIMPTIVKQFESKAESDSSKGNKKGAESDDKKNVVKAVEIFEEN